MPDMKKYKSPFMEQCVLSVTDVITWSGTVNDPAEEDLVWGNAELV